MSTCTFDFSERVVVVTGANGSLGSAVARAFADAGATLVLVGRRAEGVRRAMPVVSALRNALVAPSTDLTDYETVQTMVDEVLSRLGGIDVLANTVGGFRGGEPVAEMTPEAWESMMGLNAVTAFNISRAVVPTMIAQKHGKIVHTASRSAVVASAGAGAYSASKAAVLRLTEALAAEVKYHGINVNCIMPGTIDTPDNRRSMPRADHTRWVRPDEIATLFLYLASEAASALHGAAIPAFGLS